MATKHTPAELAAANKLLDALDKAMGELHTGEIARLCGEFLYQAGFMLGGMAAREGWHEDEPAQREVRAAMMQRAKDAKTMDRAAYRRKHGCVAEPPKVSDADVRSHEIKEYLRTTRKAKARAAKAGQ